MAKPIITEDDRLLFIRFGKKITLARRIKNMTQHQLATAIGVTHQQIQKYEHGVNRVSSNRLLSLSRALDQPITYFFSWEDSTLDLSPDTNQRMYLELMKNFSKITEKSHQKAILSLVRSLVP